MSGVSLPVTRPIGRGLIVGGSACRSGPLTTMQRLGVSCAEADDPYSALSLLLRKPQMFTAVILSLNSLYREELAVIATIKRRLPHLEVWLTQTDGRQAALVEAIRQGADGLLAEDGLHRIGPGVPPAEVTLPGTRSDAIGDEPAPDPAASRPHLGSSDATDAFSAASDPVLTADELRALLQEQPSAPPAEGVTD